MPSDGYSLKQAAADLAATGLLAGCLVPGDTGWERIDPVQAETLSGQFQGATLDSRDVQPGGLFVALAGEKVDGRDFVAAALANGAGAALSRDWSEATTDPLLSLPAPIDDSAAILLSKEPSVAFAHLAGCWRRAQDQVKLVAVTGSNGKTTTKDFIAAFFRAAGAGHTTQGNLNNELGVPLTVLGLRPEHRLAVVEMGASAAGDIAKLAAIARPEIGVITNAAEAHLAVFGSLDGVIRGKGELLTDLPADGRAIINRDSPGFAYWSGSASCPVVSFGREPGEFCWSWQPAKAVAGGELLLDDSSWQVPLPGEHNGANLVAAILAARAAGLTDAVIRTGLLEFSPSPHRSAVRELAGVGLLDDCYNANPTSMERAASTVRELAGDGRAIAVLGQMAELGDDSEAIHVRTGARLQAIGIDLVVTVGDQALALGEGFRSAGGETEQFVTHAEAANWLSGHCVSGDFVLVKGSRAAGMEEVIDLWRRAVDDQDFS
ncbi:MAG: UDP-N-acetylmuramoyl-tripeptide--D-alanyl-D-alanine ligase [bacterium]